MSFKISSYKQYLTVDSAGLTFFNTSVGTRRFRFGEIDSVFLSSHHSLSFQVANEVFSIQTQPGHVDHQNVIDFLLQEVRRTTE
jgi:hypothetical protein